VGVGLAASFLLGLLIGQGRPGPEHLGEAKSTGQPREILLAGLTVVPRDPRAPYALQLTSRGENVYWIAGRDFALEIRSPRGGVPPVVLPGPGQRMAYPQPGQADIAVVGMKPRRFGPLDRPEATTAVLVLVTATPAAETVRQHLAADEAARDQP